MSSTIWTREELSASRFALETTAWRVVEAQHRISTMKLTDSLAEQRILEDLLESTKPPVNAAQQHLHYLLFTPFRYAAANPFPSRFRRAHAPDGVFYASASPQTAIAEIAFYRLLFFAESPGTPFPGNPGEFTAFAVQLRTSASLDLTRPPLNAHAPVWLALSDYGPCQALADDARREGVEVLCYRSVRDRAHRLNYAVLTPSAFAVPYPVAYQSWRLLLGDDQVLARCEAPETGLSLKVDDFRADPRLKKLRRPQKRGGRRQP